MTLYETVRMRGEADCQEIIESFHKVDPEATADLVHAVEYTIGASIAQPGMAFAYRDHLVAALLKDDHH